MLHMYLFLLFGPWSIIFTATAVETPNLNYNLFFSRTGQSALVNIRHPSAPSSPIADWLSPHKQRSKLDDHVLTTDIQPSILVKLIAGDISGLAILFTDNELKQSGESFGFVPSMAIILFGGSKRNKQHLRNDVSANPSFNLATLLSAIASASEADETNDYNRNILKPIEETPEIPSLEDARNTFSHQSESGNKIHQMPSSSDYVSLDARSQLKEKSVAETSKSDERIEIPNIEVSHKLAAALCLKMKEEPFDTNLRYMWAPIRQHLPVWRKALSMNRYLLFTTKCLKWSLRQCRGDVMYPLKNPCTYWSPMSIKSRECGVDTITSTKLVNYRPDHFTPENCPCIWPCVESFDFIQQCRVEVATSDANPDAFNSLGRPSPGHEIEIEEDMAKQLCAGLKPIMNVKDDIPVPIRWLPLQTDIIDDIKINDTEKVAPNYAELHRKNEMQRIKRFVNNMSINVKRDFGISNESVFMENQLNTDGINSDNLSSHLVNCIIWKYRECERPFDNQAWINKVKSTKVDSIQTPRLNTTDDEEKLFQDENLTKRRRNKRSATSDLIDPVGAEEESDWAEVVRVKRQRHNTDVNSFQNIPDNQLDKVDSETCGQWIRTESHRCTPVISAVDRRQESGDFRRFQRKHVACLHFEENDETICKIRANRNTV